MKKASRAYLVNGKYIKRRGFGVLLFEYFSNVRPLEQLIFNWIFWKFLAKLDQSNQTRTYVSNMMNH